MSLILDWLIAIPTAILYNIMVVSMGNVMMEGETYNKKVQISLLTSFVGAIVAIILAKFVFGHKKYRNRALKYGMYLAASILLFHSVIYNWRNINEGVRIVIMALGLGLLGWGAYHYSK